MADRRSFNFICCLLCALVSTKNLRVDATDNPLRHGTCGIEEGEDGFCESGDENMYLENVDISDLKDTGTSLQNKEGVESFSEDSPVEKTSNSLFDSKYENMYRENVDITDLKDTGASLQTNDDVENSSGGSPAEIPSSEDDKSLSEVSDKQIDVINNSTNEWLGLQIPVVDGVRVSDVFLPAFFKLIIVFTQVSGILYRRNCNSFSQPPTQKKMLSILSLPCCVL